MNTIHNVNIEDISNVLTPFELKEKLKVTESISDHVYNSRKKIENILAAKSNKMLAVIGPCSVHDAEAALEYAEKLASLSAKMKNIYIVMRVYFEKPRTSLGWKGLIVDPDMNGKFHISEGLVKARKLLLDINKMGLSAASEVLDPIIPQYISDLISWAAIGARTTESQTHRELSSGLSMPIGFKNGTDGQIDSAINGIISSRSSHSFMGINQKGQISIFNSMGNPSSHLILRGGKAGPNYYEDVLEDAAGIMKSKKLNPAIIVDCSHANSKKDFKKQSRVLRSVINQRLRGIECLKGFMLESNLVEGRQEIQFPVSKMIYGQSVTDSCIGWDDTEELLFWADENLNQLS